MSITTWYSTITAVIVPSEACNTTTVLHILFETAGSKVNNKDVIPGLVGSTIVGNYTE